MPQGALAAAWRWRGLFDPLAMVHSLGGNPLAPLAFIALHVAASLFFVPRTLLALGAGLVFGNHYLVRIPKLIDGFVAWTVKLF